MDAKVIAQGLEFNPATRQWDKPVRYEARTRMEALNWINFHKDWMKDLRIVEGA